MQRIHGRIWIESAEGTFLGYGRVVLLERIAEFGSIRAAAKSMKMSYRHAWDLVDSMNRQSPEPLVEKTVGGAGGGGAVLTPAGERGIAEFQRVQKRFQGFLNAESKSLEFGSATKNRRV